VRLSIRHITSLFAFVGVLCLAGAPACGAAAGHPLGGPITLGNSSSPNQRGYGESHPRVIFNGGDPSGLVNDIHWTHWGSRRATGWGRGLFVWPGLTVAEGLRTRARVVAFHLGSCEGHASYDALEWFFPRYHERFHPGEYGEICSEHFRRRNTYHPRHCGGLMLANRVKAFSITAENMNCRSARRLVRTTPAARYAFSGGRFRHRGYYCGSTGWEEFGSDSTFDCALDRRSVFFEVYLSL
jgi:hypothetical protein